uniref:Nucleoporin NUP35 n=1 Tax=Echinococcus granulosus TaxID=6210 RepID=A0A068WCS2_ECHGR|nr:nucleoporin nup53 [Echinococcus granulosus]
MILNLGSPSSMCSIQSPERGSRSSEPMNVGSPSAPSSNFSSPQYLPGFLMGDSQSSCTNGHQVSPIFKSQPHLPTSHHTWVVQPRLSGLKTPPSLERSARRHAAPPTQSLWSSASQKKLLNSGNVPSALESTAKRSLLSPSQPMVIRTATDTSSFFSPFQSPLQMSTLDRSHRDGHPAAPDDESATWVTVFGYDPAQANYVLQHFAHLGTIEKYVITNGGNWMNIKYANKIQARCALNKNGRVLAGKFMIGVRRCDDLNALNSSEALTPSSSDFMAEVKPTGVGEKSVSGSHVQEIFESPPHKFDSPFVRGGARITAATESPGSCNRSFADALNSPGPVRPGSGLTRHSSMRPLATPYHPPPRVQVVRAGQNQSFRAGNWQSSGLLSKALDYVFGWS